MSHFAELNENNIVVRVLVGDNDMTNEGYDWFIENLGGRWVQTSYNGNFRGRFAGIGFTYDEELDVFKAPLRNSKKLPPNLTPPTSQENTTVYTFGDDENVT
jgi:hypothetical protein